MQIKGSIEIQNPAVLDFIRKSAELLGAADVEIIDDSDDDRLIEEEVKAGKLFRLADGNFYARSHPQDVARSIDRTFVATRNPSDKGLHNNWRPTDELVPKVLEKMRGSMKGKKMYVIPYLMGPANSSFSRVGIQVTDSRYVVINMIRMTKVGKIALDSLGDSANFTHGLHCTGELDKLKHEDRYYVSVPDERMILSTGSAYGGNALFGKKFESLRQASYDARKEGWLAEHMLIMGIEDKKTGALRYIAAAFPSSSGKTNLAMMTPPPALTSRYRVWMLGDDIAWLRQGADGRLWASNPENGCFGVVPGTNEMTNTYALAMMQPGTKTIFTNVGYKPKTGNVWWEGKTEKPPQDEGWLDWKGHPWTPYSGTHAAHPNSRFTSKITNAPNLSPEWKNPSGVPISAIFFGGRLPAGEPLIRQLPDAASGVYDGATMGVRTTAAESSAIDQFRGDFMAMLPFMSYHEGDYFQHWLNVMEKLGDHAPAFFHVNWFNKGADGKFLWPGFGENLRVLLWALSRAEKSPEAEATVTPIGAIPKPKSLNLEGLKISSENLSALLRYDPDYWKHEMIRRTDFLATLGPRLPEKLFEIHLRVVEKVSGSEARRHAQDILEKSSQKKLSPSSRSKKNSPRLKSPTPAAIR